MQIPHKDKKNFSSRQGALTANTCLHNPQTAEKSMDARQIMLAAAYKTKTKNIIRWGRRETHKRKKKHTRILPNSRATHIVPSHWK